MEVKEVERRRRRRRRTQLLDDLRNRRKYWELEEQAEDRNRWKKLSIEHREEIDIFHESMDLLISSILNSNEGFFLIFSSFVFIFQHE